MDSNATLNSSGQELCESLADLNGRYSTALIPLSVFFAIIGVVGVVGNVLVVVVFSLGKEYRNSNFRVFVVCLAFIDLVTCLSLVPAEIVKHRSHFSFPNSSPCKIKCFFNTFGTNAAAFTLLVISVDRFRKVCQPLKKQMWPGLALKILIGVLILSFVLSVPSPIMCGINSGNMTNLYGSQTTVYMCTVEKGYQQSVWRYMYKFTLTALLLVVSAAFVVMYALIGRTVVRHWGSRSSGSSVRFDNSKSDDHSERIDMDHLTDDVFPQEELHELAAKYGGGNLNGGKADNISDGAKTSAPLKQKTPSPRKFSNVSYNASLNRKCSRNNSGGRGSDVSFRTRALRRRSSSSTPGKLPYKTLIWFILTLVFIVTYFLYAVLSFFVQTVLKWSPNVFVVYAFFYRLYFVNNAINPIIYAWLDKRFKKSCKAMLKQLQEKLSHCCYGLNKV